MALEVGQELYFVYRSPAYKPSYVKVTKIGRKWADLDNHCRINKETMYADGGDYAPPGRAYLSIEDYESKMILANQWRLLISQLHKPTIPQGVTLETIKEVRRLLGIEEPNR